MKWPLLQKDGSQASGTKASYTRKLFLGGCRPPGPRLRTHPGPGPLARKRGGLQGGSTQDELIGLRPTPLFGCRLQGCRLQGCRPLAARLQGCMLQLAACSLQVAGLQAARVQVARVAGCKGPSVGVHSALLENIVLLHFEASKSALVRRFGPVGVQNSWTPSLARRSFQRSQSAVQ